MTKAALTLCAWCGGPYQERQTGGRTQRFCRPSCRRAFHTAVRSWALDAIADGTLTLAEVRSPGSLNAYRRTSRDAGQGSPTLLACQRV